MANEQDPFKDMKDQFADMRESLEKIASQTKPVEKVAKEQIKHEHRPKAPTPKIDLDKNTKRDILAALKNIRSQIAVSQRRENTMADVAADALASGQSLAGAAREALGFRKDKLKASFKRKFDPLNIVHRITGGSKLATALAGRVMGRSEQSIRSAAGLQPLETPSTFPTSTNQEGPSQVSSGKAVGLLEQMSSTLTEILQRMTDLSLSNKKIEEEGKEMTELEKQQNSHLQQMRDEAEDAAAAEKSRFHKAPTAIGKGGEVLTKKDESGSSWMSTFLKWFIGLGVAALVIIKMWKELTLVFGFLGDSIRDLWQSIKDGLSSIKAWVVNSLESVYDAVLDAGESMIEGVKGLIPGYAAPTATERHEALKKEAASGSRRAQRKLDQEVAPSADTEAILGKLAPKFAGKLKDISPDKLAAESQALQKGQYVGSATASLRGVAPASGSPERVATQGALTQMVGEAYGQLYKDKDGKPLRPSTDKGPGSEERLSSLTSAASAHLAKALSPTLGIQPTPTSTPSGPRVSSLVTPEMSSTPHIVSSTNIPSQPTELPAPAPQTGQNLAQANDLQRNAAMGPTMAAASSPTIINNIKNQSTNAVTTHQNMPPARSGESSYLRSLDRGYAPA